MPVKFPTYIYKLFSFEAYSTDEIEEKLNIKNCDYRNIVSICWVGTLLDGHYRVFYGTKIMR